MMTDLGLPQTGLYRLSTGGFRPVSVVCFPGYVRKCDHDVDIQDGRMPQVASIA